MQAGVHLRVEVEDGTVLRVVQVRLCQVAGEGAEGRLVQSAKEGLGEEVAGKPQVQGMVA